MKDASQHDLGRLAELLGYERKANPHDLQVSARGYRALGRIPRLPRLIGEKVIRHFGSLERILAATLLAALGEVCRLDWDRSTLFQKTLALEQMITTGGGWQIAAPQSGVTLNGLSATFEGLQLQGILNPSSTIVLNGTVGFQ